MNSAELPATSHLSTDTSRWDDVRRIYRRVCLLRATGRNDEALELQNTEFSRALAVAREASEAGETEAEILAEEASRVANACVLAELLAPILAEKLRTEMPAPVPAQSPSSRPAAAAASRPSPPTHSPSPRVPGIADLIDGMLSQENAFSASRAR